MVSQKKGNPSESVNLAGDTQGGLGETGNTTPVLISRYFVARQRAVINVSQNYKNTILTFLGVWGESLRLYPHTQKVRAFFLLFWGSL